MEKLLKLQSTQQTAQSDAHLRRMSSEGSEGASKGRVHQTGGLVLLRPQLLALQADFEITSYSLLILKHKYSTILIFLLLIN